VQVDPLKHTLKAPGTKRLKLNCDQVPSSVAFKFNLRRYILVYVILVITCAEITIVLCYFQLCSEAGPYTRPLLSST